MILCLAILLSIVSDIRSDFNYDYHGTDWKHTCQYGKRQSPIALVKNQATWKTPSIIFKNYNLPLKKPIIMYNNGHTVNLKLIPNGPRPYIQGVKSKTKYIAHQAHFHWGSLGNKGSEHSIDGQRYDAELHIIHINEKYSGMSLEEASKKWDGLVVFGIMIKTVYREIDSPLHKIFDALPQVNEYQSSTTLDEYMSLQQLMGNIDTSTYFTYLGSLTTPDCSESVIWIVFTETIPVQLSKLMNLFSTRDYRGKRLVNNYRKLQSINNRRIYYCNSKTGRSRNTKTGGSKNFKKRFHDSYNWYYW